MAFLGFPRPGNGRVTGWTVTRLGRLRWQVCEQWRAEVMGTVVTGSDPLDHTHLAEAGARRWIARRQASLDRSGRHLQRFTIPRRARDTETDG